MTRRRLLGMAARAGAPLLLATALAGCAGMHAKRDARVASSADTLRLSPIVDWDPFEACRESLRLGKKREIEFTAQMPRVDLPNDFPARAWCVRLPPEATLLEFETDSTGGMFYDQVTTVYPSLLFLDELFQPVADLRVPRAWWHERWTSSGLDGGVRLTGGDVMPAYVVVYLVPDFIGRTVPVDKSYSGVAMIGEVAVPTGGGRLRFDVPVSGEGPLRLRATRPQAE